MIYRCLVGLVPLLFFVPAFSQTQPVLIIQGTWTLNEMTCLSTSAKYPAKGWTISIDSHFFSSQIAARCEINYKLPYIASAIVIQLQSGIANQKCNGKTTILKVDPLNLNYSLINNNTLSLDAFNSYCGNLARYVFFRTR